MCAKKKDTLQSDEVKYVYLEKYLNVKEKIQQKFTEHDCTLAEHKQTLDNLSDNNVVTKKYILKLILVGLFMVLLNIVLLTITMVRNGS